MFKRSKKGRFTDLNFELITGATVPLRIHEELRNGYRASIGKKHLIFRLPLGLRETDRRKIIGQLSDWARKTYAKDPMHFAHLLPKDIPELGQVIIMGTAYTVSIGAGNGRKSHLAKFDDQDPKLIHIELARTPTPEERGPMIETLISRLSSQYYLPQITQRVLQLNALHFQQEISGVTLKLTKSQWGSCSTKGNINLSSRLLLVPEAPRDAVIIHELAHRIEMNHSSRFWKLVYDAMPDYDEQHAFLQKHGRKLSFLPI